MFFFDGCTATSAGGSPVIMMRAIVPKPRCRGPRLTVMKHANLLLLLLVSVPAFAEDQWRVSVLRTQYGYGAAVAYAPSAEWDVEAAVSERQYDYPITTFFGPTPITEVWHRTARPIDLFVTRHFPAAGRVAPFVHAGARYVALPAYRPRPTTLVNGLPATIFTGMQRRTSAQAGGGLRVRLTPRTALRAEVTRLLRSEETHLDPLLRAVAGISWHF
jgi:hypothetical protein